MADWHHRFMGMAAQAAEWSKDPRRRVGAVIVDTRNRVISTGYNGFPRGVDDSPAILTNREEKLRRVIHAEANALLFAQRSVEGCTLYATYPPCAQCTAMLIQAGIGRVVYPKGINRSPRRAADWATAHEMLSEVRIPVIELELPAGTHNADIQGAA